MNITDVGEGGTQEKNQTAKVQNRQRRKPKKITGGQDQQPQCPLTTMYLFANSRTFYSEDPQKNKLQTQRKRYGHE